MIMILKKVPQLQERFIFQKFDAFVHKKIVNSYVVAYTCNYVIYIFLDFLKISFTLKKRVYKNEKRFISYQNLILFSFAPIIVVTFIFIKFMR